MAKNRPPKSAPSGSHAAATSAGKVALVTGGAKRVGRGIALALADAGYDVAITYLASRADAGEVVRAIEAKGRRAAAIKADFSKRDADARVHEAFTKRFGRLDALVNNASVFAPTPIGTLTAEQFDRQMTVNALSPLLLIQRFEPMLAAHYRAGDPATTGRVVNFIDIHVMGQPLRRFVAYNASKAALQEVTRTLAMELAPAVTVNALAPGVVAWAESYTSAERAAYLRRVPLARAGTPDDAAAAAVFLITGAHYCTGQTIRLDGGRLWT